MPATGGFRKVRVPRAGMGKRGGARLIYIVRRDNMPIFLISAFTKSDKANLSKAEQNALARRADALFAGYKEKR